jgi:hypothetical protein
MQFEFESYNEKCERLAQWKNWFAWHPVFLFNTEKPTLVWLEKIQRRKYMPTNTWHYRSVPDFDLFI